MKKNVLLAIYTPPEFYPPTLNLVRCLSDDFNSVTVVCRNLLTPHWDFPANIRVIRSGKPVSIRTSEQWGFHHKIKSFADFTLSLVRAYSNQPSNWLILCDTIPVLSFSLIKGLLKPITRTWYHNHDVAELQTLRKGSVGWMAYYAEKHQFKNFDLFTLPDEGRLGYFPIAKLKGHRACLPNYPAKAFFQPFSPATAPLSCLRILYQGSIDQGHGLEEIMELLIQGKLGWKAQLVLVGKGNDDFIHALQAKAGACGQNDVLDYRGFVPYAQLPELTASCHIGIGIYCPNNIMNRTVGSASNKIYEYAALGLPVLLLDNSYWRERMGAYSWCFFTDLSRDSLVNQLNQMRLGFLEYSAQARSAFADTMNFENHYKQILPYLA